jgi:hypothetical protein
MTYVTKYETRDGKTYRVENDPPAPPGTREEADRPDASAGADSAKTPDKPAKQGA